MRAMLMGVVLLALGNAAGAQVEDFHVYSDAPRLLLTKQRLRLLQREKERNSTRWELLDGLIESGAPIPEAGFVLALYYRVSGNAVAGRKAVEWALSEQAPNNQARPTADLRQLALVFDWCGPVMTAAQSDRLGAKIEQALASGGSADIAAQSARILAAIAIADRLKDHGDSILSPIVLKWWREDLAKRLESGMVSLPHEQLYAFIEMLHALRDNLTVDLRESAPAYFLQLPLDHLTGHYPSPFPGPENDFLVPIYLRDGDPDLKEAALSRAAGLAMVAYDNNALETQYLQGWLMQDRYTMRGAFGIPYEFLWANPYQPGLSYSLLPLVFHNPVNGHVFARTSWEDDAAWIGYFESHMQRFQDGKLQPMRATPQPVRVGDAILMSAPDSDPGTGVQRFRAQTEATFVLGLAARSTYDVEIDDQELAEKQSDAGGTLVIALPPEMEAGVRIRKR